MISGTVMVYLPARPAADRIQNSHLPVHSGKPVSSVELNSLLSEAISNKTKYISNKSTAVTTNNRSLNIYLSQDSHAIEWLKFTAPK